MCVYTYMLCVCVYIHVLCVSANFLRIKVCTYVVCVHTCVYISYVCVLFLSLWGSVGEVYVCMCVVIASGRQRRTLVWSLLVYLPRERVSH